MGDALDQSSRVSAVVDLFGPAVADAALLRTLNDQQRAILARVFGASDGSGPLADSALSDNDILRRASPATYITPDDPPFLIIHGVLDTTVPLAQSQALAERLRQGGVSAELIVVQNAGHGLPGPEMQPSPSLDAIMQRVKDFLEAQIGN